MRRNRDQSQQPLPPMEVRRSESHRTSFRNSESAQKGGANSAAAASVDASLRFSEHDPTAFRFSEPLSTPAASHVVASELLDAALTLAKIENADVERLCEVSASTVHKWRSKNERACPSLAQQLCLPLSFHIALFRVMSRRFGFWRWALSRVAAAVGDLALVAE